MIRDLNYYTSMQYKIIKIIFYSTAQYGVVANKLNRLRYKICQDKNVNVIPGKDLSVTKHIVVVFKYIYLICPTITI